MGRAMRSAVISVACSVFCIVLISGCEEGALSTKKARLVGAENLKLKKELEHRKAIIADQQSRLAKCQQEKKALQNKTNEVIKKNVNEVLKVVIELNKKLQDENKQLKSQVTKLEKELKEAKQAPGAVGKP